MDTQASGSNCTVLTVRQAAYTLPWAKCDRCQVPAERVWDAERAAIDIDRAVLLLVQVSVHHRPACDHFFRAQPPFLRPDATYTNRVVTKAVQSVQLDGVAMSRVSERMGRGFWAKPSEASIRLWCQEQAARLDLAGDYQQWVVQEFSGVLCVDEFYQGDLALLLAIDPAGPEGDRLAGFQLLRGHVEQRQAEEFLLGLREVGIVPAEVVTDGSSLCPTVLAQVWPAAAHQLRLFRETRAVTESVLEVVREIRRELPKPPLNARRPGRLGKYERLQAVGEGQPAPNNRPARMAAVRRLRQEGRSLRGIVRLTGISRNTVRRWLSEETRESSSEGPVPAEVQKGDGAEAASQRHCSLAPPTTSPNAPGKVAHDRSPLAGMGGPPLPPAPCHSWDEVRRFAQTLTAQRYLLVQRQEHLRAEEKEKLGSLLGQTIVAKLPTARDFLLERYALFRDERGRKRSLEEAQDRYRQWQAKGSYRELGPLRRFWLTWTRPALPS